MLCRVPLNRGISKSVTPEAAEHTRTPSVTLLQSSSSVGYAAWVQCVERMLTLPTTNHTTRNGPTTHIAQTAHGKQAASVKVAALDCPLLLSTLSAKMVRKTSQAAPFTHSHRLRS